MESQIFLNPAKDEAVISGHLEAVSAAQRIIDLASSSRT